MWTQCVHNGAHGEPVGVANTTDHALAYGFTHNCIVHDFAHKTRSRHLTHDIDTLGVALGVALRVAHDIADVLSNIYPNTFTHHDPKHVSCSITALSAEHRPNDRVAYHQSHRVACGASIIFSTFHVTASNPRGPQQHRRDFEHTPNGTRSRPCLGRCGCDW